MKKTFLLFLLLGIVAFFAALSPARANHAESKEYSWVSIGPDGGYIKALAQNPQKSGEIYALQEHISDRLLKSTDSGKTWKEIAAFNSTIIDIAVDPRNSDVIYLLSVLNIHKSEDGGKNWQVFPFNKNSNLNEPDSAGIRFSAGSRREEGEIVINPIRSNILYVPGTYHENYGSGMAVAKSKNGGKKWEIIKITSPAYQTDVLCLAINPLNPNELYVGGYYSNLSQLFKTTDGGKNWLEIKISDYYLSWPESIAIDPINPSNVYVGTGSSLYRSSDGGQSWSRSNACAKKIVIDPIDSNTIYAAGINWYGINSFYKSTNRGENWTSVSVSNIGWFTDLLAVPFYGPYNISKANTSSTFIFYSGSAGILKSIDGGTTWNESNTGIRALYIQSVTVAPSSPDIIYTFSGHYFISKSYNSGATWTRLSTPYQKELLSNIAVNPLAVNELFIIVDGKGFVYKSSDGGYSWKQITPLYGRRINFKIVFASSNSKNMYANGKSTEGIPVIFKSTDGGMSWESYNVTSRGGFTSAVAVDPKNENIVYAGVRYYYKRGSGGKLFKSTDGGKDWIEISQDISRINSIAINPVIPSKIYVGTDSGVYKSEDSGLTWRNVAPFINVKDLKIVPSSPRKIFAGGYSGVYYSFNSGRDWREINKGLTITDIECMDIIPERSELIVGTNGGSLFKLNYKKLPRPPKAPRRLKATAKSRNKIKLTWKDMSENETGFKIERKHGDDVDWTEIAETKPDVEYYLDKGLKENTLYQYRIRAFNSIGPSLYSNIAKARTKKAKKGGE